MVDLADRDVGQGVDRVGPVDLDPVARHQDRDRKSLRNKSGNKGFA